jgi:hypothetical protein
MKKFLTIAFASTAILATPAFGQTWQGQTYGQDAVGWYDISADVDTFCKFGTSNTGTGISNATVDTNAYSGAQEADGRFMFDIQDDDDNTVQGAQGRYDIANAVCNTEGFTMTVESQNGGLQADQTTSDPAFVELLPYNVHFIFDGIGTEVTVDGSVQTVGTSPEARAGSAQVWVRVDPRDELVLEGTYADKLIATIQPNV